MGKSAHVRTGSKMGKSAHVRTSVEPHSNLKLVSLFPRGSKMGNQLTSEPQSNLIRTSNWLVMDFEITVFRQIFGNTQETQFSGKRGIHPKTLFEIWLNA